MIVSYTNQSTPYGLKNRQQPTRNFDASLVQETGRPKFSPEQKQTDSTTTTPPNKLVERSQSIASQDIFSNGNEENNFKQKFSLLSSFAIQQYTALGNLEIQKAKSAILGFSEYA